MDVTTDEKIIENRLNLIEEAIKDCRDGKMSYFVFTVIVSAIINIEGPTQECINWAIDSFLKKENKNV